jgi:pyruvate dehydrogenase E1 component
MAATEERTGLEALEAVQDRVLWLAMSIVHHANKVRTTPSGVKVGGHQASSASMVSIMTALWFAHLRGPDRVSVKPHASPVLHAIEYLLGDLDERYLTTLRAFGGLQSYPSRLKDPVPADFSTGSVGIGATAPIWSAIAHRYVAGHFEVPQGGRHIALLGDAELDEGAIWETLVDPLVAHLGEVLWVVDLNRQSLDRIVPDIAAGRIASMFEAAGWQAITVKYGRWLRELFARDGGDALRRRIDEMPNEEYQRLLRSAPGELRERLPGGGRGRPELARLVGELDDEELVRAIRDLGGHDLQDLLEAFAEADRVTDRPSVVFAYTIKAWRLATQGHPANHSALLSPEPVGGAGRGDGGGRDPAVGALPGGLGGGRAVPRGRRAPAPPGRRADAGAAGAGGRRALARGDRRRPSRRSAGSSSTCRTRRRTSPSGSSRSARTSRRRRTSAAGSTTPGSGTWATASTGSPTTPTRSCAGARRRTAGTSSSGIAEGNLVGLLGELGSTWSRDGQALLPIGTIYDPFVTRALEPWSFGMYAGGQSILVGTPSGVTLAPEGGAHQSIITPSIGLEQPRCTAWEPAFGQDLEWALLHALGRLGQPDGASAYFRLTTRPVDQALAAVPEEPEARELRRRQALAGGYRLRTAPQAPAVTLVGVGAVLPEVLAAAEALGAAGVPADVVCLTSPDLVFRALQARQGLDEGDTAILDELLPAGRVAPIVSVLDGHPHTLSFLGAVRRAPIACLGVRDFGQSGDVEDLYRHFGIDAETIVDVAIDLLEARPA